MIPIDVPCLDPAPLPGMVLSDSREKDAPDNGLVVTPGGPRPRDKVHPVKPGETLRQNPDGSFTVVPAEAPPGGEKKEEGR